jgi:hypothetical protein
VTPRLSDILERLQPVVREEMLKVCAPNCCVATVAVLCRVLRHHGFNPRGLAVSVIIRNRRFVECRDAGMVIPDDKEAVRRWMEATGAWCLGIVPESALESLARGYPAFGGHVVCHVQDVLVDASLCQANRPQKGIVLPDFLAFPAAQRFLDREGMIVGEIAGCEVEYRPLRDQSWRKAPDWQDERRYRQTVNAILERSAANGGSK